VLGLIFFHISIKTHQKKTLETIALLLTHLFCY